MRADPYRTNVRREDAQRANVSARGVRELLVPFALVWAICIWHVASIIVRGAAFDAGDTLALGLVVILPWLLFRAS
jgi:hypothetical protein